MKKYSLALVSLTCLLACKVDHEHHGAGSVDSLESGADPSAATDMTTFADGSASQASADDSDTNACGGDDWEHYTCQGWIAGMYESSLAHDGKYQYSINAVDHAECVTIPICEANMGGMDNEYLYSRCKAACDAMVAGNELPVTAFPAHDGVWDLKKTVCVFADNGNNGTVPLDYDGVPNQPTGTQAFKDSCDNIGSVLGPTIPQVIDEGCFDNDMCANEMGACPGWDPGARITSSLNATTKVYTVTIKKSLIAELLDGDYSCLYAANEGMWTYTDVPSPLRWKFKGLSATHFYYKMGFRNDDWDVKIKKNAVGATVYSLSALTGMGDAFDALNPGTTSFVITFKRGTALYTMNLTFVN